MGCESVNVFDVMSMVECQMIDFCPSSVIMNPLDYAFYKMCRSRLKHGRRSISYALDKKVYKKLKKKHYGRI